MTLVFQITRIKAVKEGERKMILNEIIPLKKKIRDENAIEYYFEKKHIATYYFDTMNGSLHLKDNRLFIESLSESEFEMQVLFEIAFAEFSPKRLKIEQSGYPRRWRFFDESNIYLGSYSELLGEVYSAIENQSFRTRNIDEAIAFIAWESRIER